MVFDGAIEVDVDFEFNVLAESEKGTPLSPFIPS